MSIKPMVTMLDVAKYVGVSRALVSKVLYGGSPNIRVGSVTAEKIRKAALALGHRANSAARAIKNGRLNTIALLQSTLSMLSILPQELLEGIHDVTSERGIHLLLSRLPDEKLVSSEYIPKILSEFCADGLLINYNAQIPQRMIELIRKHIIPSIWINSKQESDCIYPDDFDGGYTATRYLQTLGHKRIFFINYSSSIHYSAYDRQLGYEKAMKDAGLESFVFSREVYRKDTGKVSAEILSAKKMPTALIAYTEKELFGVYKAAFEMGIKIPENLSLIVFNPRVLQHVDMSTTTVILPEREIGIKAVEMLMKKIANPEIDFEPVKVKCHIEIGNTTQKQKTRRKEL